MREACKPACRPHAIFANPSAGMWDVTTATFAICKGKTEALDIVSVLQPPGRRYYSFLSITYGLIANLDVGTENLRWGCTLWLGLVQHSRAELGPADSKCGVMLHKCTKEPETLLLGSDITLSLPSLPQCQA